MTNAPDNAGVVRGQMFGQMAENERRLKEAALQVIDGFRKMLYEMARRMDGERIQGIMRSDPSEILSYSPAQWGAFFDDVLKQQEQERWQWAEEMRSGPTRKELQQKIADLNGDLAAVKEELDRARKTIVEHQETLAEKEKLLREAKSRTEQQKQAAPSTPKPKPVVLPKPEQGKAPVMTAPAAVPTENSAATPAASDAPQALVRHTDILLALSTWKEPSLPAQFKKFLDQSRWPRQALTLYLMLTYGLNIRMEIEMLIARKEGRPKPSGAIRGVTDALTKSGLLTAEILPYAAGRYSSNLSVMRLTQDAYSLCAALGWPEATIEPEWVRLIRDHDGEKYKDHTFGVLAFMMHARVRGWGSVVLPKVSDSLAQPDVLIERDGERHYVEVEMGSQEKSKKWQNLNTLQGHAAICTGLGSQRERLVSDCRRLNIKGVATDIEALTPGKYEEKGRDDPFWQSEW